MTIKLSVRASELPDLLDRAPARVKYLSLDCFDTLLWRNCIAPRDVFAELPVAGGGLWPRAKAEARARQRAYVGTGKGEVRIEAIYRAMMPGASEARITEAVQQELNAEARHCYGFAPTVALMKAAKARGLKIIIVSDTYLSQEQLRDLIAAAAGEEVIGLIDRIFVSCDHGVGKAEGLFKPVLKALNCGPEAIFHVGDNKVADQDAPTLLGIPTAHLVQFTPATAQRLRLEAAAAAMVDPAARNAAPIVAPHRPVLSLHGSEDAAEALGHDVLGPIMTAFARWVEDERVALSERLGSPVKPLFLMRDGHLPLQVYRKLYGKDQGEAVEISRFSARRANLSGVDAIRDYLFDEPKHGRVDVLSKQIGLSKNEALKLTRGRDGFAGQKELNKAALGPATVRTIVGRSKTYADGLIRHLRRAGVQDGDAVMLVDLGYAGSVQTLVEPVLRERMNLQVAGRYLLLRDPELTEADKKGLLDPRHYDLAGLHAMSMQIAVVEQLCTVAQGSVVGYDNDGVPIRNDAGQKGLQNQIRDRIQAACIAYAGHSGDGVVTPAKSDDGDCRRRSAASVLARFLFLPIAEEVEVLQAFDHDINLGSNDMVALCDPDAAEEGLRRRGLFYLNQSDRMYFPGELQRHGLPQMLSLFAASRHQLDLRPADFQAQTLELTGFLADGTGQTILPIEAYATHDGYFLATIPVGEGRFAAGIAIGAAAEWVQVEEASFHAVSAFHDHRKAAVTPPIPAQPLFDGMEQVSPGFYRCGEGALMLVPPPPPGCIEGLVLLSIVFRPVVRRAPQIELKAAA